MGYNGYIWRVPEIGLPHSWMVDFMENPHLKWMMTGVPIF